MLIRDFYANREILATGGTGFLGKSLIEKLLRDCTKVKVVYLIIRSKQKFSTEQRLEEYKKSKIFDRIRQECPQVLDKLHAIDGDSMELGLGIKPEDMELLKNVSVIFHMAANVRFDDPLRSSILLNTRGTYELIKIAEKLKNLVAFVHCSTTYVNPLKSVVEEEVDTMAVDWRKTIKMAETLDETTLNIFCLKYTGFYPNTYTFTKNLSEQLVKEYSNKLPMFIFRPSIVMSSLMEPEEGYIENLNGPIASLVAVSIGLTPVTYSDKSLKLDAVPVDLVSRLTLVAAYKRGLQTLNKEIKANSLEVVNCASGNLNLLSNSHASVCYHQAVNKNPMENAIWYYDPPYVTSCYSAFLFYMFVINIPMSILMDSVLRLMGHKPLMLKMQRRIIYRNKALKHFAHKQYNISNKNMYNLENSVPLTERNDFGCKVILDATANLYDFIAGIVNGVKKFLFNQPVPASKAALKRHRILKLLNRTFKYCLYFLLVSYLWSIVSKL